MRRSTLLVCVGVTLLVLPGKTALADHFDARGVPGKGGHTHGIVRAHYETLFEITTGAGGYTPLERAQIIAKRLDGILDAGQDLDPVLFAIDRVRGMMCVVQRRQASGEDGAQVIVTIERGLARSYGVSPTVLAEWWLALLRDHMLLAIAQPPRYLIDTHLGEVFTTVHELANRAQAEEEERHEQIELALRQLTSHEQRIWADVHSRKGLKDFVKHKRLD